MSDWIELDDPDFFSSEESTEVSGGVEIVVGLSPFDLPEKVRGNFDEESNEFVIEFKYLDESERRIPKVIDQNLTVLIGENSHRPYAIHIDVHALKTESVQLSLVTQAMEKVANTEQESRRKKLMGVARRIVERKGSQLVPAH